MRNGAIRFVILAAPRTGSNMLCTILDAHPRILCHHEIFNPNGIFYALNLRDGAMNVGTMPERDADPLDFLARIWQSDLGHVCVGFKMTHRQNEAIFQAVLHDPGVKKIILRRGNRVKTFVSFLVARQLDQWEVYHKSEVASERPKVRLEPEELERHIEENEEYYREIDVALRESGQEAVHVEYEKLSCLHEQTRVLNFLGVSMENSLDAKSVKQNPTDLRKLVVNFDDLAARWGESELGRELRSLES